MNERQKLIDQGIATPGDVLGESANSEAQPPTPMQRFEPSRLAGCPPLPPAGIYFGMSDEHYHSLPALSMSGIKKLAASPMIFWASTPWLSERKRRKMAEQEGERFHQTFGKAYHCRILEGAEAFYSRYAAELDPAEYPNALEKTAQIQAAIKKHEVEQPVKPSGSRKDDLEAQLRELDPAHKLFVRDKYTVQDIKEAIGQFTAPAPVQPVREVPDELPDGTPYMRQAVKADWVAQLLELDPDAVIFDAIDAEYRAGHAGKTFLTFDQVEEIERAALMIEKDPTLKDAFSNGFPEVTLIWHCPVTGVPMKARCDYLKLRVIPDLKTVANQRERSIENAIRFEIATYRYNMQPCVYFEGAEEVRREIRERGASAIAINPFYSAEEREKMQRFAMRWAQQKEPDEWLWVFQQKGDAPITRGVWFPRGSLKMMSDEIIRDAKRTFRTFSEELGTEAWVDIKPPYTIADEDVPNSAVEI